MKKIISVLLVTFSFFSCSTTEKQKLPEVVRYNGETIPSVREFVQSIEVIKLGHHDSITIGDQNFIQQRDSSFYIGDLQGTGLIYRFNRQGHFLNSIGKIGRGPGEYLMMCDFYVSDTANQLYVLSNPFQLFLYDKQGHFIRQKESQTFALSFTQKDDHFWLYAGFGIMPEGERVLCADSSLNIIRKCLPLATKVFPITNEPAFTSWKNERYLTIALDPFFYKICSDTLQPVLQFDFGKYNITDSFWKAKDSQEAHSRLRKKGCIFPWNFFVSNNYIIVKFFFFQEDENFQSSFIYAIKNLKDNYWDWVCHKINSTQNQMASLKETGLDCFSRMKGFTQDGKFMVFLYAHELELLKAEDKALIQNPELLENADPEMDMFILLCTMK